VDTLIACIDANVFLSALAFDGLPERVVDQLLAGNTLYDCCVLSSPAELVNWVANR
jgi:hypothetical protein